MTPPLVLLGSGGWIPTGERETCCALLRVGDHAVVIDAGTGLRRLLTDAGLLDGIRRLTILLTHFHLDHTAGLSYVPALPEELVCDVVGPGLPLYGVPTAEVLDGLLVSPYFPVEPKRMFGAVRDLDGGELELAGLRITWRRQERHTDPTVGYRIDDAYAYCTDTAHDPATVPFAEGARVLLHEAVYAAARTDSTTHAASGEAAELARKAGVERLVLIHRTVLTGTDEDVLRPAAAVFEASTVATDGFVVSV